MTKRTGSPAQREIDKEAFDAVLANAFVFLNKAIGELTSHNDRRDRGLSLKRASVAAALVQIAFELALNARAIEKKGLASVVVAGEKLSLDELAERFDRNSLQTKNVNQLRDELQEQFRLFTEDDLDRISQFQQLRNKLVHFRPVLYKDDLYDLKYEMTDYIVHVIVPLLPGGDSWPESEGIEAALDVRAFKKLVAFPPYVYAMARLASENSEVVLTCLFCGNKTYAKEAQICYACNYDYEQHEDELVNCPKCRATGAVIFDHMNIEFNKNRAKGRCLNCGYEDIVFKCPKCSQTYLLKASKKSRDTRCASRRCIGFS